MKKPKTVIDAEAVADAKKAEFDAAKEAMSSLEKEWYQALAAVHEAQTEADLSLPQCRLVRVRSGEEDEGPVVILRRTAGGMLVVRHVGQPDGAERKFKWVQWAGKFQQSERSSGYGYGIRELRDVPAAYLPQTAQAA